VVDFALHPQLAADTWPVARLGLSRLLLMNDTTYPWLILVPERPGLSELYELSAADQIQLMSEVTAVSCALTAACGPERVPDKLNVAALGNVVPQLHVHVIARYRDDPAWPAPVWGRQAPKQYDPYYAEQFSSKIKSALEKVIL
jgi:diadenosine tetraphosphate (Ap4A) HIT family hydrolase